MGDKYSIFNDDPGAYGISDEFAEKLVELLRSLQTEVDQLKKVVSSVSDRVEDLEDK